MIVGVCTYARNATSVFENERRKAQKLTSVAFDMSIFTTILQLSYEMLSPVKIAAMNLKSTPNTSRVFGKRPLGYGVDHFDGVVE